MYNTLQNRSCSSCDPFEIFVVPVIVLGDDWRLDATYICIVATTLDNSLKSYTINIYLDISILYGKYRSHRL